MARVFISYKRDDKDKVFRIKEQIESQLGEKCWIDIDGIESDAHFVNVIIKAIDSCEIVLFMYSKLHEQINNFEKDWTVRELIYAQTNNKRIVFINIDDSKFARWFDFMFPLKQRVDGTSVQALDKLNCDIYEWLNQGNPNPAPPIKKDIFKIICDKLKKTHVIISLISIFAVIICSLYIWKITSDQTDPQTIAKTEDFINRTPLFERPEIGDSTKVYTIHGVKFRMKLVKGGSLWLGATPEQTDSVREDEGVIEHRENKDTILRRGHRVTIEKDFWIGETEVTHELWEAVMHNNPSDFKDSKLLPVEKISFIDCKNFLKKLTEQTGDKFTLPTEAEWEYAARGGVKYIGHNYSGCDTLYKVAWHVLNSKKRPHEVAQLVPNELGIYDMSGNVYEWCEDYANRYSYTDNMKDPCETQMGEAYKKQWGDRKLRVIRGGSWHPESTSSCRVAFREYMQEDNRAASLGLRIVMRPAK